jgi:hypothetical protein
MKGGSTSMREKKEPGCLEKEPGCLEKESGCLDKIYASALVFLVRPTTRTLIPIHPTSLPFTV